MCIYIVSRSFTPKDISYKAKEVREVKCCVNKLGMKVVEKLTHVVHTFLLRTKLIVNEQSELLYALTPKHVLKIISQCYVFFVFSFI